MMKKLNIILTAMILMGLLVPNLVLAAPPNPTYGSATVDGNIGEWDLTNDFFADMHRAGDPDKEVESKLYLRYDCSTNTLYALVLGVEGVPVLVQPDDAFIKLGNTTKLVDGNSGDDGTPPDFAWVGLSGGNAEGWEASAPLAPGTYDNLNVHTQVFSDGESQTSAVKDRAIDLVIECVEDPGSLEVTKTVNWNGAAVDTGKTFEICITGPSYPSGDCKTADYDGDTLTWDDLELGDYTVTETDPGTEWTVTVSGSPATVESGSTAQASVTNTHDAPGSLEVTKTVDWNGADPDTGKTFEICITGPSYPSGDCKTADYDGGTLTWDGLEPGDYTVTETDPGTEWTVTVSGSPATVESGSTAQASVTNTHDDELGSLEVTKIVNWNKFLPDTGKTFEICIAGPSYPNGDCKTADYDGGTLTWDDLEPGDYTVTETDPGTEWTVTIDSSPATVEVGSTAQVEVTNTHDGTTAVDLIFFTAEADGGSVTLAWETAAELDNAGFNVYRATSPDGPWTRINDALLVSQGDAVFGASYSFADTPGYGAFYYQLEDVDYFGVSAMHGPVSVEFGSVFRAPQFRPAMPEF